MRIFSLFLLLLFLISCKPARIVFEEELIKLEISSRRGIVPFSVTAKCEFKKEIGNIPCLDEEWLCIKGEPSTTLGEYVNKISVENQCENGSFKTKFWMEFSFDFPGTYTIRLILKKKNGEIFASASSPSIIVESNF